MVHENAAADQTVNDTKESEIEIIHTEVDDIEDLQQPSFYNKSDILPVTAIEIDEAYDEMLPDDLVFGLMGAAESESESTSTNLDHQDITTANPTEPLAPAEETLPSPTAVPLPVDEDLDLLPTVPEGPAASPGPSQTAPSVSISEGEACSTPAKEALPAQEAVNLPGDIKLPVDKSSDLPLASPDSAAASPTVETPPILPPSPALDGAEEKEENTRLPPPKDHVSSLPPPPPFNQSSKSKGTTPSGTVTKLEDLCGEWPLDSAILLGLVFPGVGKRCTGQPPSLNQKRINWLSNIRNE